MLVWLAYDTLCALPLALLALLARRLRAAPALEHLLWLGVLVRLVLPPLPSGETGAPGAGAAPVGIVSSGEPDLGDRVVAVLSRHLGSNWSTWAERALLAAFLATLAWVLVRELLRAAAVERCVRRSRAAGDELEGRVRELAARLGIAAPRVRLSDAAPGPFLWSLRRPVLVLPAGGPPPATTVLAHELAHLRRRDHWTAWLELVVQALHFWNPLFWLARRRLHLAAEMASDGWVVRRFPGERRAFASALIDAAERAARGPFLPRAVQAIGMDRRDFEQRLVSILHAARPRRDAGRGLLALGLVLACLTLPGLAAPSLAEFRRALPMIPAGMDLRTRQEALAAAEARLTADPDAGAAELQRGIALLGLGRAEEALAAFERQERLGFQPAKAAYNQACALVRLGELDAAVENLARAADLGLDVAAYVDRDPDLEPLRGHPGLAALVGR